VVLRHALALLVHHAEVVLGLFEAGGGRLAVPGHGQFVVARHALAVHVHEAQAVLGAGDAAFGQPFTRRNSAVWRAVWVRRLAWGTVALSIGAQAWMRVRAGRTAAGGPPAALRAQHADEARQRDRAVVQVALHRFAAVGAQVARLRFGLDAFGHQVQAQAARDRDDRQDHRIVALLVVDLLHEGLVDLDRVDREAVQVGQRRIAGAEVVDRHRHAQLAQFVELLDRVLRIADADVLGDLDLDLAGEIP
jgi:hypothetical protein